MSKRHYTRYTKELLEPIVASSFSYAECIRKLNRVEAGGNYRQLQINIDKFELDDSHFTGQCWNKGKEIIPFENLTKPKAIKKRLIKERGACCENCGLHTWMEQAIPLELEHIDANNRNNDRTNLKLLCPNCHALTPTWRRGGKFLHKE